MMNQDDDFRAMLARAASQLPNKPSPAKPVAEPVPTTSEEAPPTPLGDGTLDGKGMSSLSLMVRWAASLAPHTTLREGRSDREYLAFLFDLYESNQKREGALEAERRARKMACVTWVSPSSHGLRNHGRDWESSQLPQMSETIAKHLLDTYGTRDRAKVDTKQDFRFIEVTFKPRGAKAEAANETFKKWCREQRDSDGPWQVLR